jgi:hypothetical protein
MPLRPQVADRIRLFVAALGVALIALIAMWTSFVLVPQRYFDQVSPKWGRFGVVTIVFAAYCLRTYWGARKQLGFWVILLGIFMIHFFGVGYFFYIGQGLPLLTFGPTVALEWALLALSVYHFLGIGPPLRKLERHHGKGDSEDAFKGRT